MFSIFAFAVTAHLPQSLFVSKYFIQDFSQNPFEKISSEILCWENFIIKYYILVNTFLKQYLISSQNNTIFCYQELTWAGKAYEWIKFLQPLLYQQRGNKNATTLTQPRQEKSRACLGFFSRTNVRTVTNSPASILRFKVVPLSSLGDCTFWIALELPYVYVVYTILGQITISYKFTFPLPAPPRCQRTPSLMISHEFWNFFLNNCAVEHLRMATSEHAARSRFQK